MQAGTEQTISSDDTYDTGDAPDGTSLLLVRRHLHAYRLDTPRRLFRPFGQGNPRASFPSIAVGWVFSNEKFMEKAKWLNYGKLPHIVG